MSLEEEIKSTIQIVIKQTSELVPLLSSDKSNATTIDGFQKTVESHLKTIQNSIDKFRTDANATKILGVDGNLGQLKNAITSLISKGKQIIQPQNKNNQKLKDEIKTICTQMAISTKALLEGASKITGPIITVVETKQSTPKSSSAKIKKSSKSKKEGSIKRSASKDSGRTSAKAEKRTKKSLSSNQPLPKENGSSSSESLKSPSSSQKLNETNASSPSTPQSTHQSIHQSTPQQTETTDLQRSISSPPITGRQLPENWVEYRNPDGRSYYFHLIEKKTTWKVPQSPNWTETKDQEEESPQSLRARIISEIVQTEKDYVESLTILREV
eukprot:TRINITY_DN5390_c0_g1_i3.p1 TRINITY_DN5390_c0_g1~~TRINITY_DN5390_c0_g1_i3.p1  ORF type:complete len:328 (-),score=62.31 TRINITY_DN5390_c0_g1_i3:34-1017(-)